MREIVYSKVYFPAVSCFPAIFLHCSRITYNTVQSWEPLFYFRTKFLYLKNSYEVEKKLFQKTCLPVDNEFKSSLKMCIFVGIGNSLRKRLCSSPFSSKLEFLVDRISSALPLYTTILLSNI